MVKEGEENEKKGWFGRKKKSSSSSQAVSRPPTTNTTGLAKNSASESGAVDDDDELPPREGAATPTPSAAQSQTPSKPATPMSPENGQDGDLGSSDIPVHAGFNFAAIKEVLGKTELGPSSVPSPQVTSLPPPTIHVPPQRSESAPPPPLQEVPLPITSKPRPSLDLPLPSALPEEPPEAGPSTSTRADLSSTLSRSMSLNNMPEPEEADMTSLGARNPAPSFSLTSPNPFASSSSASRPTALALGANDGPSWDPDPTPTYGGGFGGYRMPSGFSGLRSADVLAANPFASAASSGLRSDGLPAPPDNPFAPGAPSLSFGGADGSITFSSSPTTSAQPTRNAWDFGSPYGSGKKGAQSALDLNPWQS